MNLVVIGVNHKTAPVALRERLAFSLEDQVNASHSLSQMTNGYVIISTCNRMEIYALVEGLDKAYKTSADDESRTGGEGDAGDEQVNPLSRHAVSHSSAISAVSPSGDEGEFDVADHRYISPVQQLFRWLASNRDVPLATLTPHLYCYKNLQAVSHWLRVASGLDSMILGEPQIFGQIKQAVQIAKQQKHLSKPLGWLAEQIFAGAKQVRHDTQVGSQAVSLGFASAKLVTQIFDNPASLTLLVVASGEMNRLVATHICELGVNNIMICNRRPERAQELAQELARTGRQITVHSLESLPSLLPHADVVSSCSGSMHPLVHKKMVKTALKKRRYRPMLMVDLAVPRDIEPNVGKLDDVYLYSIDDLQHVIAGNLEKRRQAAVDAELLVSQLVVSIQQRWLAKQVGQDIVLYRQTAEHKAQNLLAEALRQLQPTLQNPNLPDQDRQIMENTLRELTHKLTQTLIHPPSQLMRDVAQQGDTTTLAAVVDGLNHAYRSRES